MTLKIDETYLPVTLTSPPMTDEEFVEFCSNYPDYLVEQTAEGELLLMPPSSSITGSRGQFINYQLVGWAMHDQVGTSSDAATGFHLPSGARRSADAAWTRKDRVMALSPAERRVLANLPGFRDRIAI